MKNIMITGGAGFIGSNLVIHFVKKYPDYNFIVIDSLTYAGNFENLSEINNYDNFTFLKLDIRSLSNLSKVFNKYAINNVIHLAAESHVDNSILNPLSFAETNVIGTINLLELFKNSLHLNSESLFYHISTDEVYGSLGETGLFTEESSYSPNSPYSASKASSDHFVRAYGETYKIPYLISNCSNNYGKFQYPEKFIPLIISRIMNNKHIPIYGNGNYTRDWLHVSDHVNAIDILFSSKIRKETFNIGGLNEIKNINLVRIICDKMDQYFSRKNSSKDLIKFVKDRPGHDFRYAIDCSKLMNTLNWKPLINFETGIEMTIKWYIENQNWLKKIESKVK